MKFSIYLNRPVFVMKRISVVILYNELIIRRLGRIVLSKLSLRKHAYPNILKILQQKKESFQIKKNPDIFHIPAQNIDFGYSLEQPRRGSSNEDLQSITK